MRTNKYGETLFLTEEGKWVPWYISNLIVHGNSVIPDRPDLTEEYIHKKYGLKVKFRYSELVTISSVSGSVRSHCKIAELIK